MNVFLTPGVDAAGKPFVVRDPVSRKLLAAAGEWKEHNEYWQRRIRDKDVVETMPPGETLTPAPIAEPLADVPAKSAKAAKPAPEKS